MNNNIRQKIKARRASLSELEVAGVSAVICDKIINSKIWHAADKIALYMHYDGEVDPIELLNIASQTKSCYLPVLIDDNKLEFHPYYHQDKLVSNKYGIREPEAASATIHVADLDLVLVPLVAFDANCNRLGQGMGYYDRTFAFKTNAKKPFLIGLAYEFQLINEFTIEAWDIPVDAIITEQNIYGEYA